MRSNLITINEDMPVRAAAELLTRQRISGAPVVNQDGRPVGVVSQSDITALKEDKVVAPESSGMSDYYLHGWETFLNPEDLRGLHIEENDGVLVKDIMTPALFEVEERAPISLVADTMVRGRVHRLLVVRNNQVVGIVTVLDVLKALSNGFEKTR